ncbi:hypothetical protein LOTGIDRAFT_169276 [Lottia gigantea]|uniref:Enoyl reductase (ER) domain-containing protein n=1 Tax=Lottia gigantea TaxID=225164 RepID=V3ZGY9_LOTGI|nr:hypothetical protein LOTGIDRAFT_169276 [Lottia gigantea]ESO83412.1 hypothetical protein LOTGIDRAFT_169276 [Lottia gigantea]
MIMKAAQFKAGGPEGIYIDDVPVPKPLPNEILIKVMATAINRADTLQRKGLYPPPPGASDILGLEAVGIVQQLGTDSGKWKVGDRVMGLLPGGGNAEYVAAHEDLFLKLPQSLDFLTAAAIPEVWLTAFQLLHTIGKVQKGETVLIHGGGSGVGTALTQLVKLADAIPFVTAGTQEKLDKAKSLGAFAGFNYKNETFGGKVIEITAGKGANIILDCVGGSFYEDNIEAVAVDGRWIVYGLMGGGNINGDFLSKLLRKRITITGTTLRARSVQYKKELIDNFSKMVLPNFESGKLQVVIDTVMPLSNLAEAHSLMEANKNNGKIIIQVDENLNKDEL